MSDAKQGKGRGRTPTLGPPHLTRPLSGPSIQIGEAPIGRSTLVDVEDDMRAAPWPRPPLVTVSYDDVPLDGKKKKASSSGGVRIERPPPPRPAMTSVPEIEITAEKPLGRETLALISDGEDDLDDPTPGRATDPDAPPDALELRTFVVPSTSVSPRATDAEKRAFVRDRLAHRLPCPVAQVRRIDAKLLEPGAVVLRIWCPVE